MKSRLIENISANTLQIIVNQLFGLIAFFILSTGLDKNLFGQINLVLAILLTAFNILSFGIDQVIVRKIASGEDPKHLLSVYLCHVVISGTLFYLALGLLYLFSPGLITGQRLLLFMAIGKLMVFFSTPFKQLAAGFERFKLLSWMSVISNTVRGMALLGLMALHQITLKYVVMIFIAGDAAEFLVTVLLFKTRLNIPVSINLDKKHYSHLIKTSFPQLGVVIFTSALARFDWIFIGFIVSAVKLAEYSFAYKIFEISTLPLLALAPLLVPRFTQWFKNNDTGAHLKLLLRMEMVVSALVALILNLAWTPWIDLITGNKYGLVNVKTVFTLSLCMPVLYLNNFLWSIGFAKDRLKMIFGVIAITFVVNITGDILLIPFLKSEGAALAYLIAMMVQGILYLNKAHHHAELNNLWVPLLICTLCAVCGGFIAITLFTTPLVILCSGIAIYGILLLITRQFRFADVKTIRRMLS